VRFYLGKHVDNPDQVRAMIPKEFAAVAQVSHPSTFISASGPFLARRWLSWLGVSTRLESSSIHSLAGDAQVVDTTALLGPWRDRVYTDGDRGNTRRRNFVRGYSNRFEDTYRSMLHVLEAERGTLEWVVKLVPPHLFTSSLMFDE
jgi:hypothetical protein